MARPGYGFTGWNTDPDGLGTSYDDQEAVLNLADTAGATVTLFAQWEPYTYTIRFNANHFGVTGAMANQAFVYDTPQALTANGFSLAGYTFSGWHDPLNGRTYSDGETINILPPGNGVTIDLYAQWTANSYTVHFEPNGGMGTMADQNFTYDVEGALQSNAFSRPGYGFTGWNTDPDGLGTSFSDGQAVVNLTAVSGGTVVLYAQWTPYTYTVRFNANHFGATGAMPDQSFVYGTPQALTANAFSVTGYTFTGWHDPLNGKTYSDGEIIDFLPPANGMTLDLYAQWTPYTCVVCFFPNGGTGACSFPLCPGTHKILLCTLYVSPSPVEVLQTYPTGFLSQIP